MRILKNGMRLFLSAYIVFFSSMILARTVGEPTVPVVAPRAPQVQPAKPAPQIPQVQPVIMPQVPVQVQSPMRAMPLSRQQIRYTQSEAYLQRPELRNLVTKSYYDKFAVVNHMDLVSRVMAAEAELRDTHWALYHGTNNVWTVWQDTYTALFNHFNPSIAKEGEADFIYLRTKGKANIRAKDFLVGSLKEQGLVDDTGAVKGLLLSTNIFLFGNTPISEESTWLYIMKELSHAEPDRAMYESIMDEFGLSYQYVDEIMKLVKLIDAKQQTLLQIFVPKNLIDDIGYLAWTKGIPAHQGSINWVKKIRFGGKGKGIGHILSDLKTKFKKEQEKNPLFRDMLKAVEGEAYSLDDYLAKCCNDPASVPNMNEVQARLIFTDDILLNPASGVKMYRYPGASYRKMKEYKDRLDALIKKMVATKK